LKNKKEGKETHFPFPSFLGFYFKTPFLGQNPQLQQPRLSCTFLEKESFYRPKNDGKEENQNGNLVDAMHHAQVDVGGSIWVRLFEDPQKIIPYFTQFEKLLYLILF
jgi:hypothetical protein